MRVQVAPGSGVDEPSLGITEYEPTIATTCIYIVCNEPVLEPRTSITLKVLLNPPSIS